MLPEHEWLAQAKRLAVGMKTRIKHRHEHRMNLIIANDPDKYWCYCQRCHEGAVIEKEHVKLLEPVQPGQDTNVLPTDMQVVLGSEFEVPVMRFLASKEMALTYLPNAWVSAKAKRVLIELGSSWHGRDLTGRSAYKWMNYSNAQVVSMFHLNGAASRNVVVTEDLFSACKVLWATKRAGMDIDVICALGTQIKDALVQRLFQYDNILWFFDNDPAGNTGAMAGFRRMRTFVHRQRIMFPPLGCDPKDMHCNAITNLVKENLYA